MSQRYEYTDSGAVKLTIQPSLVLRDGAYVEVDWPDSPVIGRSIHLPAAERQAAAQALAGDRYRVVPAVDPGDTTTGPETPQKPEPVKPWTWRNGDIVEIESADGLSLVRGEVRFGDHLDFRLVVQPGNQWINLDPDYHGTHDGSTVRVVRTAPDPAEQERAALKEAYHAAEADVFDENGQYGPDDLITALHARGVRVTGGERS